MKYIDADRLKAEIERLGRNWDGVQELQPVSLFQADLYELLDIIDSLQQEQPKIDLEKEYKEYVEDDPVFSILTNRNVGLAIARHFYELGLKAK